MPGRERQLSVFPVGGESSREAEQDLNPLSKGCCGADFRSARGADSTFHAIRERSDEPHKTDIETDVVDRLICAKLRH